MKLLKKKLYPDFIGNDVGVDRIDSASVGRVDEFVSLVGELRAFLSSRQRRLEGRSWNDNVTIVIGAPRASTRKQQNENKFLPNFTLVMNVQ